MRKEIAKVCDVMVVAPVADQSAAGHSLTLQRPLRLNEISEGYYSVDGTPTDAVMVAVHGILNNKLPDILISGINRGPNMGDDVTYSGTVSAAFEGAILGIPSVAVSSVPFDDIDYAAMARFTRKLAKKVLENNLPESTLLNVNIPNPTNGKYPGVRITRLGKRVYRDIIVEKIDPRGRKYYWIAGEPDWHHFEQSDFSATSEGFISITPLKMDMTDYELMQHLEKWKL